MAEYDDDLDGIPMEDVGGVPFDPVHAVPIPPYMHMPAVGSIVSSSFSFPLSSPPVSSSFVPSVSAVKVALFDAPHKVLTPFDKKRIELEMKRATQEAEAAKEYAKFVDSFEGGGEKRDGTTVNATRTHAATKATSSAASLLAPKAFVSGGVIGGDATAPKLIEPATLKAALPSTSAPPKQLPFLPPTKPLPFQSQPATPATPAAASTTTTTTAISAFSLPPETDDDADSALKKRKKPVRAIDAFLQELKQHQDDKAAGRYIAPVDGSRDTGDPNTTNLFVGNLSPELTEKDLMDAFAVYGDIASVKIMWPRREEPSNEPRNHHQGFVSYMRREDAEASLKAMHGAMLFGMPLKMNWSRAVPLPSHPIALKGSKSGGGGRPGQSLSSAEPFSLPQGATKYDIAFPSDPFLKEQIDLFASYVYKYGLTFEHAMLTRARATNDPSFAFLTTTASLEHLYYRWRLWSLVQGDSILSWRVRPFQMVAGGAWWVPPDPTLHRRERNARRAARENAREKKRRAEREGTRSENDANASVREKGKLNEEAQKQLMDLLRQVTMERNQIMNVMGFCLDHSDSSKDVVDLLVDSLTLDETPIPKKLARLYVVSDILHNSGAPIPNAASYRSHFEVSLPSIFASFHRAHTQPSIGRLSANVLRDKVTAVLQAWNRWALFPQDAIQKLEHIFHKGETQQPQTNQTE